MCVFFFYTTVLFISRHTRTRRPPPPPKWPHPTRDGGRTGHTFEQNDLGRRGRDSGRMSLSRQGGRDLGPGVQCVSQLGSGPGVGLFGVLALLIHDDIFFGP